jgi:hypothetical protein
LAFFQEDPRGRVAAQTPAPPSAGKVIQSPFEAGGNL